MNFWSRVAKGRFCWVWIGSRLRKNGAPTYGNLRVNGKMRLAHRVSWQLANGKIPRGMNVLHECDNMPCVRPRHLYLGSLDRNNKDRAAKGRSAVGERAGCARLTEKQVLKFRKQRAAGTFRLRATARQLGMSHNSLGEAVRGQTWKHI